MDVEQLTVIYRDEGHALLALDRVDLSLRPGRITALVGESGSGKTTLGRALMGLLPENSEIEGRIRMDADDIVGLDEPGLNALRWSKAAMVFQNGAANLNPVYRLVDQVAEPLRQRLRMNQNSARDAAGRMLRQMGLNADVDRRYPHELSGGQVQKALLAMALILDPEVLILDEPTAAMDAMTKVFISGVIQDLKQAGKGILLITHDLELAQSLGDDLVVLYLGQIMERMPARDLLRNPQHPYTLALGRSFPGMEAVRDLGGIRGDAFYRLVHAHARDSGADHTHAHVAAPDIAHQDGHAPPEGCLFHPRCTQAVPNCRQGDVTPVETGDHQVRCLRGGIADLMAVQDVEKSYESVHALLPTTLTLRAGEVFCLVGETGSGKSTLAMIAAGALDPDQGRRFFESRNMDNWLKRDYRSLATRIGVIYQYPAEAVSHRFTVFDIVAEPLRIQNGAWPKEEIRDRVLAALSDVHLSTAPEFLKRYPHELNMGAIQRLCLARALVHGPVFLVADEPTSALDPSVQAKVMKLMLDLQINKGLTLFFITHNIGLARKIADRIGVMLAGRLIETGPAEQVITRPGHPYTRMLVEGARGRVDASLGHTEQAERPSRGCPFLDRCPRRQAACVHWVVEPVDFDDGRHRVWCRSPYDRPVPEGDVPLNKPDSHSLIRPEPSQRSDI